MESMRGPEAPPAQLTDEDAVQALGEARRRTLALVQSVSDEDLERVHSPLMSPLVWDLGHIAAFEDLWLLHRYGERPMLREALADIYDAFETPRADRGDLPFLGPSEAREYLAETRERSLEVIAERGVGDGIIPELIIRHEHQHNETMLQTLQLARLDGLRFGRGANGDSPGAGPRPASPLTGLELVANPRRRMHARRPARRLRLRQRAPASSHRCPRLPDRAHSDHQRLLPDVCGRGWLRAT